MKQEKKYVSNSNLSYKIAQLYQENNNKNLLVIFVSSCDVTDKLIRELEFYISDQNIDILTFNDWEILPYDQFSPHSDLTSHRIETLYKLPNKTSGIAIISVSAAMHNLVPKEYIFNNSFFLSKKDKVDLIKLRKKLQESGYYHTNQVQEHGEFSIRGSIIDLFPMGSKLPFRIDLFDDTIDSIRTFDIETQRTCETLNSIRMLPAREYPLDSNSISFFRDNWREKFSGDPRNCQIYIDVSEQNSSPGIEYYIPLFFNKTNTIFDYLPDNSILISVYSLEPYLQEFRQQINDRYEQYSNNITQPLLLPNDLFINNIDFFNNFERYAQIKLLYKENKHDINLSNLNDDYKYLFCAETNGRKEIFKEQLMRHNIYPIELKKWDEFIKIEKPGFYIIVGSLEDIFYLDQKIVVIPEVSLTGHKIMQRRRRKTKEVNIDDEVRSLAELKIGSPVVHVNHGIGRYLGLTNIEVSGRNQEFVTLEYAKNNKLYVPVTALQLISRYSGANIENAPLHALGSDRWQKEKNKAAKKIKDVAAELLEIYAQREAGTGIAFTNSLDEYNLFASTFPFEETIDQKNAIKQVIEDLTTEKPMDRVICGDVGFGKTEVAMRAAFLTVQNGMQVSILVPTTLLAEQHYQTFIDRFSNFPFNIEVLSRFKSKKESDLVIEKLKNGACDIVIGTHKLLQKDIKFKSLGLLIIDEEHRFGVSQKEKFKSLRAEINILTLTATPIPRTLNMAMANIRDLSIITTPPAKRLAVKTFVREYNEPLIEEAISRELRRGGQVYYLHNNVETIKNTADLLLRLLPNARIEIAHGQMPERELEKVMSDFYHRKFNILVCTTIIETGIDIPSSNTIIIDRADKLGLAQLHQLRGRVGRSHHQAYAFCLTPPWAKISSDAKKRLEAVASLDSLGAGFNLATHDLEIRGAGELLGDDQSGHIHTIGYSLYMELINYAVKELKNNRIPNFDKAFANEVEINLQICALIPDSFIPDVHTRLILYKRISNVVDLKSLYEIKIEIIDRFGKLPIEIENLIFITKFKIMCITIGIKEIKLTAQKGKVDFIEQPKIEIDKILNLIRSNPVCYKFLGSSSIGIHNNIELETENDRLKFIDVFLNGLLPKDKDFENV